MIRNTTHRYGVFAVLVAGLGPAPFRLGEHFKPRHARQPHKLFDPIGGQNDVDVLRHPTDKPMPPNGPAAGQDRWALHDVEQTIDCLRAITAQGRLHGC